MENINKKIFKSLEKYKNNSLLNVYLSTNDNCVVCKKLALEKSIDMKKSKIELKMNDKNNFFDEQQNLNKSNTKNKKDYQKK